MSGVILPRPTVAGAMFGDLLKTSKATPPVVHKVTSVDVTTCEPANGIECVGMTLLAHECVISISGAYTPYHVHKTKH